MRTTADHGNLSLRTIVAYAYPTAGISFLVFLFAAYYFKFATDILLIAPAAMGLIFAAARIWDAVSDPMAGYLSDRTRSRFGRRRPWLFASVIPVAIVPVLIWSPPAFLDETWIIVWVTVGILAYETALTMFIVPHTALGAELSMSHHERTRVFAFRHVGWMTGFFINAGAIYLLTHTTEPRSMALILSAAGGGVTALLVLTSAVQLRERSEHAGRGPSNPLRAMSDVVKNPDARLLLMVFLIENLGTATLGILVPFVLQYVVGSPGAVHLVLLCHFVPSLLIIPLCVPLTRRFGKKAVWAAAGLTSTASYTGYFFVGQGDLPLMLFFTVGTGIGLGIAMVVGPSVQADVIDYDEHETGERKEGLYYAAWNFIRKVAQGVTAVLAGFTLQLIGFVPNAEQTESTQTAISVLFAGLPATAMAIGTALFIWKFKLTEDEHKRIRAKLDARR